MKIKFIGKHIERNYPGDRKNWHPGDVDDIDEPWASNIIAAGKAKAVSGKPKGTKTKMSDKKPGSDE